MIVGLPAKSRYSREAKKIIFTVAENHLFGSMLNIPYGFKTG